MTKLTPVRDLPSYAVIIRCVHERGEAQREALVELHRRGLHLSEEQRASALSDRVEQVPLDSKMAGFPCSDNELGVRIEDIANAAERLLVPSTWAAVRARARAAAVARNMIDNARRSASHEET